MPSQATALAAVAFSVLLNQNGELVTLQRADGSTQPVLALVDRKGPPPLAKLTSDGGVPTGAIIQIDRTIARPEIGSVFIDDQNGKHRVSEVEDYSHCWNCKCTSRNVR